MTEDELVEANGLVARFYARVNGGPRLSEDARMMIQRRLLMLGVKLSRPIPVPDPTAPEGGSAAALAA